MAPRNVCCKLVGWRLAVVFVMVGAGWAQVLNGYINPLWATDRRLADPSVTEARLGKAGGYYEPAGYYAVTEDGRQYSDTRSRYPIRYPDQGPKYTYPTVQRPDGYAVDDYRNRIAAYPVPTRDDYLRSVPEKAYMTRENVNGDPYYYNSGYNSPSVQTGGYAPRR